MKCLLKKDGKVAASFRFEPHTGYFGISDCRIQDEEKIPFSWKLFNTLPNEHAKTLFLEQWIRQRCIPDYRINLDAYIQEYFATTDASFGRMNGFQNIPALISLFLSAFDRYSIEPAGDEILYFGFEDFRITKLFVIRADNTGEIQALRDKVNTPGDLIRVERRSRKDTFPDPLSFSTTIHSGYISWVEKEGERIILKQDLRQAMTDDLLPYITGIAEYTKDWQFPYHIQNGFGSVDITDIFSGGETSWLQEYLPYLVPGKPIQQQYLEISETLFGSTNPIDDIFGAWQATKTEQRELSLSECGVIHLNEDFYPIIII